MSKLRDTSNGDDHPDAAGKHLDDAAVLLAAGRFDGAAYHAGYVVECSLKSVILVARDTYSGQGHSLSELSEQATRLAAMPNGSAARYTPDITGTHALYARWRAGLRYRSPGAILEPDAKSWVDEARRVYTATVARMRLDGVV